MHRKSHTYLKSRGIYIIALLSCLLFVSCENFQVTQTYERPCGTGVDTSSLNAGISTSPHDVVVYSGSRQNFWPQVFDITCQSVKYTLSKNLGSIDANGLYTAPTSLATSSDSVFLYVQSYAKPSLIDTVRIQLLPPTNAPCDVSAVHYSTDVLPILNSNCMSCHSTRGYIQSGGGIDLDSITNVLRYVNNGLLLATINYSDTYKMPRQAARLDTCDVKKIRTWIEKGAPND